MKRTHYLFKEKYRPESLENYICDDDLRGKIQSWITAKDFPHLLLHGTAGTGKTTLAKLLVANIDCEYLYINATDERSIDVMRDKVKAFASTMSFKPLKVVILDEATHILQASQVILLNIIEIFSLSTRFILTGNYPERLIDPLRSRLHSIKMSPPAKSEIAEWILNILEKESIKFDLESIAFFVNLYYPDVRKILDECQHNSSTGTLKTNERQLLETNYLFKVLEELKKSSPKSFKIIRQIIADSGRRNFEDLYKFLYDNTDQYAKNEEDAILILAEMEYQSSFCIDKEINIASTISKLLKTCKTK